MQRNVSTVPIHHRHNAQITFVAARRCKETSRLYKLTIGTPRNFTCAAAHRCTGTSRLYRLTAGTPRNLYVMLLTDAKTVSTVPIQHSVLREIKTCCCSPMQKNVSTVAILLRQNAKFSFVAACRCSISTVQTDHRHTANYMCCCSPMQINVSTVPNLHRHNAKFTPAAARRCKETSRLYRFNISTPRNLHVLLLADGHCTDSPWAHREIYMCCCSPMQGNVSTVPIHHRHNAKFYMCCCSPMQRNPRLYRFTTGTPNLHVLLFADAKKRFDCTGRLTIGTPARQRLFKTRLPWVYRLKIRRPLGGELDTWEV